LQRTQKYREIFSVDVTNIPFHRVEGLAVQIVQTLQLRHGTLNHVHRYADLGQSQASHAEICN